MNPWLIFWAPQLHLPFGGSVAQRIDPDTNWFFGSIAPTAGDANIEQKAFEVASYGRQLGLITEILIDIAESSPPRTASGVESLRRLRDIKTEIDKLKERDADSLVRDIETKISRVKRKHKGKTAELRRTVEAALSDNDA